MKHAEFGRARTETDGCRRYLPHAISFDTQARTLTDEIDPDWDPAIIARHEENRRQTRTRLIHQLGNADHERKIRDVGD